MLRVKALGPCTISGFRTLLRGDVCDVPVERREQVECLRKVGRLELLELPAEAVTAVLAEPSGNEVQAAVDSGSAAPPALTAEEEAELAALTAELEQVGAQSNPDSSLKPKRQPFVCVCGKTAQEHAAGKTKLDESFCGGLKKFMKRAEAAADVAAP
jgi:hypothetical protein